MILTLNDISNADIRNCMQALAIDYPFIDPNSIDVINDDILNRCINFNFYSDETTYYIPLLINMELKDFPELIDRFIKKLLENRVSEDL